MFPNLSKLVLESPTLFSLFSNLILAKLVGVCEILKRTYNILGFLDYLVATLKFLGEFLQELAVLNVACGNIEG